MRIVRFIGRLLNRVLQGAIAVAAPTDFTDVAELAAAPGADLPGDPGGPVAGRRQRGANSRRALAARPGPVSRAK